MTTPNTLMDLRSRIKAQRALHEEALQNDNKDLEAVERTLVIMHRYLGVKEESPEKPKLIKFRPEDFAGLSQLDAIVLLAEKSGGVVKIQDARRMLIEARLTQSKGHVSQVVTGTIIRSKRFDWAAPGTYRLIPKGNNNSHQQGQRRLIEVS